MSACLQVCMCVSYVNWSYTMWVPGRCWEANVGYKIRKCFSADLSFQSLQEFLIQIGVSLCPLCCKIISIINFLCLGILEMILFIFLVIFP